MCQNSEAQGPKLEFAHHVHVAEQSTLQERTTSVLWMPRPWTAFFFVARLSSLPMVMFFLRLLPRESFGSKARDRHRNLHTQLSFLNVTIVILGFHEAFLQHTRTISEPFQKNLFLYLSPIFSLFPFFPLETPGTLWDCESMFL